MRRFIFSTALILAFLFVHCSENKQEVSENQLVAMRTTANDFMKELKGVLIQQMQTGGIVQAVSVCSDTAQLLTNKFGVERGVFIKRVSLKNRNKNNFPDDVEKRALNKFELLKQNNELDSETEFAEITTDGNYKYLRYLKPIILQAECLNCHGNQENMMPDVKDLIAQNYPADRATGYKVGDLRGAVSIKISIE
jgi:Protein of unknown function (DUF3365)